VGLRVQDLLDAKIFREKLDVVLHEKTDLEQDLQPTLDTAKDIIASTSTRWSSHRAMIKDTVAWCTTPRPRRADPA